MDKTEVLVNPKEEAVSDVVQPTTTTPVVPQEEKPNILKRFWYLFVILGVTIVLFLGILVYGYQKLNQEKLASVPTPTPIPTSEEGDEQTSALEKQGTSDETGKIEDDLKSTELSGIDQELEDIDSEFSTP